MPVDVEMAIQLKILSFDEGLKDRVSGDTIVIAVLHAPDKKSESTAGDYVNMLATLASKGVSVHGKKLRAVAVPVDGSLDSKLAGAAVVYVTSTVTGSQLAQIAKIAQTSKLPSLCGERSYLSNGIAVAVVQKDGKPGIIVHATNAARSGMMLDAKLLRLAEIVK